MYLFAENTCEACPALRGGLVLVSVLSSCSDGLAEGTFCRRYRVWGAVSGLCRAFSHWWRGPGAFMEISEKRPLAFADT